MFFKNTACYFSAPALFSKMKTSPQSSFSRLPRTSVNICERTGPQNVPRMKALECIVASDIDATVGSVWIAWPALVQHGVRWKKLLMWRKKGNKIWNDFHLHMELDCMWFVNTGLRVCMFFCCSVYKTLNRFESDFRHLSKQSLRLLDSLFPSSFYAHAKCLSAHIIICGNYPKVDRY